jgi:hypothetical protein
VSSGPVDKIRFSLESPTIATTVLKAELPKATSALTLLKWLQLRVLRVNPSPTVGSEPKPAVDVYFTPVLPEIPTEGVWDPGEERLRVGALGFFIAIHEATQVENPFKYDFQLKQVSLSFLPTGGDGWPLDQPKLVIQPGPSEPSSSAKVLVMGFKVDRRDDKGDNPWSYTLKVTTNFDRMHATAEQPVIESKVSVEERPTHTREARPKEDRPAYLLDMLKRYGRASGSINIKVKIKNPPPANNNPVQARPPGQQPAEPSEPVEILKFDADPSASTK